MGGRRPVRVFPDYETMSRTAAELVAALAREAAAERGRFAAALSGGTTPVRLYEILAGPDFRDRVPWSRVHLFWSDERCVPKDHQDSNYRLVAEQLFSRAPLRPENVHRIRGEEGPEQAARAYEEELRRFFGPAGPPRFDLILLGMGRDGHTASLFPGSPACEEKSKPVAAVHREKPDHDRVTLTLPVLNSAAHVLFLVAGAQKADAVSQIVQYGNRQGLPAGFVKPANGVVQWYLDEGAARKLKG